MTLTKANTTAFLVETLANLYLKGKPAEISDETITQLCDWLMAEFHQLPLKIFIGFLATSYLLFVVALLHE
ncbi:hypothetical protein [Nostoc sp.]|uniref:hypothetical protein n=1 Tax=Nostoc sp. TaxID=1180 RepID=UPI002FF78975